MATLNPEQLAEMRVDVAHQSKGVPWRKPHINAAFQALEDWFDNERTVLVGVLNRALAPVSTTVDDKRRILTAFIQSKAGRER